MAVLVKRYKFLCIWQRWQRTPYTGNQAGCSPTERSNTPLFLEAAKQAGLEHSPPPPPPLLSAANTASKISHMIEFTQKRSLYSLMPSSRYDENASPSEMSPDALLYPFPLEASLISSASRKEVCWPLLWALYILLSYAFVLASPLPVFVWEVSLTPTFKSSTGERLLHLPINPRSFVDMLLRKPGPRLTGWWGIVAIFIIPNPKTPQACVIHPNIVNQ